MDHSAPTNPARRIGRVRVATIALFAVFLLSGPALAACSDAHSTTSTGTSMSAMPTMHGTDTPTAATKAVWAGRPDYVRSDARTEEAYAFALAYPQIVAWMPCYCGCEAMGHGSNLDCYFKHGVVSDKAVFEEHASFCDICVDITLKAKQLDASGRSLQQIRQAIDETFGRSGAPGTLTAQPPA
jgi:hypothetical protein